MNDAQRFERGLGHKLLADVSRSFYLSIRLLPPRVRGPIGLAYLLARASDTIADTTVVPVAERKELLKAFCALMKGDKAPGFFGHLESRFGPRQEHAGEGILMGRLGEAFLWWRSTSDTDRALITEVIDTITKGQLTDLERYENEGGEGGWMESENALLDYTQSVAGCVGKFWTETCFLHCGATFSTADPDELSRLGQQFGRGLQLLNILRDLPEDMSRGRHYLPVPSSEREGLLKDPQNWMAIQEDYWGRCEEDLQAGLVYAQAIEGRRLRAAVCLPALIGLETLEALRQSSWEERGRGVKIPRKRIYVNMVKSLKRPKLAS